MANRISEWDKLMSELSGAASSAADNAKLIGTGFMDEMIPSRNIVDGERYDYPPETKFGDGIGPYIDPKAGKEYQAQTAADVESVLSSPVRMLQRAMEYYSGGHSSPASYPTTRADVAAQAQQGPMQKVFAGVTDDEDRKAQTKLIEAQTRAATKRTELEDRNRAEIDDRLAMLASKSKADNVFVAKGNRTSGKSDGSNDGAGFQREWDSAGGGSFSKSQRPTTEQNAIAQLIGKGMTKEKATAIVDSLGIEGARQAMAQAATTTKMPSTMDIIKEGSHAKDIAGFMALLERLGVDLAPQKKQ
jgi:hypothetical protein